MASPPDYRFTTCEECGGDGQIEGPYRHFCHVSGDAWGDIRRCGSCDGVGTVCIEVEPIGLDDLEAH